MIESIAEFERVLKTLNPASDDFVCQADDLVEQLDEKIAPSVYEAVFRFFENHPDCDCGAPGTLVHHVERYYPNYVDLLMGSARTIPSYNSILMLNRILNSDINDSQRSEMLGIISSASINADASPIVRDLATGFIEHQSSRYDQ